MTSSRKYQPSRHMITRSCKKPCLRSSRRWDMLWEITKSSLTPRSPTTCSRSRQFKTNCNKLSKNVTLLNCNPKAKQPSSTCKVRTMTSSSLSSTKELKARKLSVTSSDKSLRSKCHWLKKVQRTRSSICSPVSRRSSKRPNQQEVQITRPKTSQRPIKVWLRAEKTCLSWSQSRKSLKACALRYWPSVRHWD